jgi:peptide/nickel transport system substrate-binding protein/oligopeptide transport system substrate-binding protein
MLSQTGLNTHYLGFNCSRPPFDNPVVRQAFNYAIHRKRIIQTALEGQAVAADGSVPPMGKDTPSGSGERLVRYEYSPSKARKLLKQAKFDFRRKINFFVRAEKEAENIAAGIEHDLSQIGVRISLKKRLWTAYKQAINKGEPDIFYLSWSADYPDPQNFLRPCFYSKHSPSEGNRVRFRDEEVDRLLDALDAATDEGERARLYAETERRIVEAAPWVFLWHRREYVIRQPWVEGWKMYPIYNANKATGVTIRQSRKR